MIKTLLIISAVLLALAVIAVWLTWGFVWAVTLLGGVLAGALAVVVGLILLFTWATYGAVPDHLNEPYGDYPHVPEVRQ